MPSIYRLFVGTESKNTQKAIQALYDEVNGMTQNPPTAAEVQKAKDAILNSFVFTFDTKAKILEDRMKLEFYGYPADYHEKYPEQIAKVTVDDVNRVAKKYLNPSGFAVLVVVNSLGIIPKPVTEVFSHLSRWCLVVAIAALGVKTSLQQLAQLGWRPVVMLATETAFLAALILGGLLLLPRQ